MKKILITGGAGFIGVNLAGSLARRRRAKIVLYDDLSRRGVERNLEWILGQGLGVSFVRGDVRDLAGLKAALRGCAEVYHLAAQVAVTTSVADPIGDFEVNAGGTLRVLEACRQVCPGAVLVFASTNKVYGELLHVPLVRKGPRYVFRDGRKGISESECLDFHSPYGNSKGCADQYVRDYHRIYGMRTVVFRQSCIYGPHQYGNEDQGWVAHFLIKALLGKSLTVYGDGKQVRDLLDVSDLVRAYGAAVRKIGKTAGQIYNIGGGAENTLSLRELLALLKSDFGLKAAFDYSDWRPGDQKIFVSDNGQLRRALGWAPKIGVRDGIQRLYRWVREHLDDIKAVTGG